MCRPADASEKADKTHQFYVSKRKQSTKMTSFAVSSLLEDAAYDFGQKVDLSVRIREILRNYPEGLSIIKELIQNADDAGARAIKFCVVEARSDITEKKGSSPLETLMSGPSLLAYNSALFTETDFQSIQRIGDSLKKAAGGKTGRFGVGVNSTYHLTDVPMFVSGTKVVLFDPQAKYVPGINPANPGKLIDFSTEKGRAAMLSLPELFEPFNAFNWDFASGQPLQGTMFRFALRTVDMTQTSSLSRQTHSYFSIHKLLQELAQNAPSMLLFLKHIEEIEIYRWDSSSMEPYLFHTTSLRAPVTDALRKRRAYMLHASPNPEKPISIDYIMEIESKGTHVQHSGSSCLSVERWVVCNQLGGGRASLLAKDPSLSHMNLLPWAGVAARVHPIPAVEENSLQANGAVYCFLPLPVSTQLPVHVNGFFELSSNRRDIWWGDDMAGDGRYRAEWNKVIISDIASVCYCRLIAACIKSKNVAPDTYEYLLPNALSLVGPWEVLGNAFYSAVRKIPILFSQRKGWITPADCVLLDDANDAMLTEILLQEDIPLVILKNNNLRTALIEKKVCVQTTTPAYVRSHFSSRLPASKENALIGSLENKENRIQYVKYLLSYCISNLEAGSYKELSGCQFIPLANGELGTFCPLPVVDTDSVTSLQCMGFTTLTCYLALRKNKGDKDRAIDWLSDYSRESHLPFEHGFEPYFLCSGDCASLLRDYASHTFVDLDILEEARLQKFFRSSHVSSQLNVVELSPKMIADIVIRVIPGSWRGIDHVSWSCENASKCPNSKWFVSLWTFICKYCSEYLPTIAEQYCIVPTNEGVVCNLSPGTSVIDASNLPKDIKDILTSLGARTLLFDLLPSNLHFPKDFWSYIHTSNREGVVKAIETAIRRNKISTEEHFENLSDQMKIVLYGYLANPLYGFLSETGRKVVRTFPIFRSFAGKGTTKLVPLSDSTWYVIDFSVNPHFMPSTFLACDGTSDLRFLNEIGVQALSKKEFYRQFFIPSLSELNHTVLSAAVETLLLELPILCSSDEKFCCFMKKSLIIPTANSLSLRKASDLFDPEIPQLKLLMDSDCFPQQELCKPSLLPTMRLIGLQTSLNWDALLICAKSIDERSKSSSDLERVNATACGKALLSFLDQNLYQFFPEFLKNDGKKSSLFQRMNAALFEDPVKKKLDAEEQAKRKTALLSLEWVPVLTSPPHPLLPWLEEYKNAPVASPLSTTDRENMWLLSYTHRIIDGRIHNEDLMDLFGWSNTISIKDVAIQLCSLSAAFDRLTESPINGINSVQCGEGVTGCNKSFCRVVTSHIPRLYNELDRARTAYDIDVVRSSLFGISWLWMGDRFIRPDNAAFSSTINASPYLYTVPQDLLVFENLLKIFGVRKSFGTSDFNSVLHQMKIDAGTSCQLSPAQVELATNIVQIISDDVMQLDSMEIYAPSSEGRIFLSTVMTYDDAPWLSKNLASNNLIFIHPKLSNDTSEKIGAKSFRSTLINRNADLDFGAGVLHESFSQTESITRRIKSIIELYPEGPQQLFELIQNADDAGAKTVRFLVSKKQFGTTSLFGKGMSHWQGPSLLVYNDSTFEMQDFNNICKIAQSSKLEKLTKTGRFGLGFNSVYHWTDVPAFVSGSSLVIFDPHKTYLPADAGSSGGIKIHFQDSSLSETFSDQMKPFFYFGFNGRDYFPGTLFRFPFRNDHTASRSEISKAQLANGECFDLIISGFRKTIGKALLFLRSITKIEMYFEGEKEFDIPELLYYAEVCSRTKVLSESQTNVGLNPLKSLSFVSGVNGSLSQNEWSSISDFISCSRSGKDSFYSKLLSTPENKLPRTQHLVAVAFYEIGALCDNSIGVPVDVQCHGHSDAVEVCHIHGSDESSPSPKKAQFKSTVDKYLVLAALGGGRPQIMACNPKFRHMKLLPWGGVAAHLSRNEDKPQFLRGNAFCFLPLPAETGFPVHINGYFELSSNRRDIWTGDDMTGEGKIRWEWNRSLLNDVIAPLYVDLLVIAGRLIGPGDQFKALFPVLSNNEVWGHVLKEFYREAERRPLFFSNLSGGQWVTLKDAVIVEESEDDITRRMCDILLSEGLKITTLPRSIIDYFKQEGCQTVEATASWTRSWFRQQGKHPSLAKKSDALFLLKFCSQDVIDDKKYDELIGLPLLPLCDGSLGVINANGNTTKFFVCSKMELDLLCESSRFLVDVWSDDISINQLLTSSEFHSHTNISILDRNDFVSLMGRRFPEEWRDLPEVRWDSSSLISSEWVSKLWHYISSTSDPKQYASCVEPFLNSSPILPAFISDEERTLMKVANNMAVVCPVMSSSHLDSTVDQICDVLKLVGVRVLDISAFSSPSREPLVKALVAGYVQPLTAIGVLRAIRNTFPSDIAMGDIIRRISIRFRNVSESEKNILRRFLAQGTDEKEAILLDLDLLNTFRALPIFPVYHGDAGGTAYSDIVGDFFVPPRGSDVYFLKSNFVKAEDQTDESLLKVMGIKRMEKSEYYEKFVCPTLLCKALHPSQEAALLSLLEELPQITRSAGTAWIERMADKVLLPNIEGEVVRVDQLFDPTSPYLTPLLGEARLFPGKIFCQPDILAGLRQLGLQTRPTFEGIILTASRVQLMASQGKIKEAQKLGASLLTYLDDEGNIRDLVGGQSMKQIIVESPAPEQIESLLATNGSHARETDLLLSPNVRDFFETLKNISWVPVESFRYKSNVPMPPADRRRKKLCVAAPLVSRLKEDAWISSYTFDVLSMHIRSDLLKALLGWDKQLPPLTAATQLLALAESFDKMKEIKGYPQCVLTAISKIYDILDASFLADSTAIECEKISMLLLDQPWVWVGDRFARANQVAFEAPDNARPYLFGVPSDFLCFSTMFNACGVKQRFLPADYINLSVLLRDEIKGEIGTPSQIDLAVCLARLFYRIPPDDRATADLSKMCLPSKDGFMYDAKHMIFDDAPWLSSIVNSRSVSRLTFVHSDISNEVARSCGARSFREILSACHNGMSTFPCPNVESLTQLFTDRAGYKRGGKWNSIEDCRAILDLLEVAEMTKTKRVTIMFDFRSHKCESLIHPMLAIAQGPSVNICFHDTVIDLETLVKLSSPASYIMSSVRGSEGCFLEGHGPRAGLGLAGVFRLTDYPQILVDDSLIFIDPIGDCFFDGGQKFMRNDSELESKQPSRSGVQNPMDAANVELNPTARRYQLSHEFPNQFPDQLEPFLSLPLGVKESFALNSNSKGPPSFRGTIFRLPFRMKSQRSICDRAFLSHSEVEGLMQDIVQRASSCFLFTMFLKGISILKWAESNVTHQDVLETFLSSSPTARKNHFKELKSNDDWKRSKNKLVKLLQSSWVPVYSSLHLQITSRFGCGFLSDVSEVVDHFFLRSILAPSKLPALACSDALKHLKLIPALSVAAHVGRIQNDSSVLFPCSHGTLCVGIPTPGEITGLPFFLNAPLFQHELDGSILLGSEDDRLFRMKYPKAREVIIQSNGETRSLAFHVWNRQAISSAMNCLIPSLLIGVRDVLLESNEFDKRVLYRLWPQKKKIGPRFRDFFSEEFYDNLGSLKIFMTEKSGFQTAANGVFVTNAYNVSNVALNFFRERISLFTVPQFVVQDLEGRTLNRFNPAMARQLLNEQQHLPCFLQRNSELLLDVLEYCLSDLPTENLESPSSISVINELRELCIIPTEANTFSSFRKKMIVATPQQQALLPSLKEKFVSFQVIAKLQRYFDNASFLRLVGLDIFGPQILSDNIKSVLPPQWEGKDFVKWDITSETPSKLWIYQFWREVKIYDTNSLQLFQQWPLIPTTTGELASCGNARFILAMGPSAQNDLLSEALASEFNALVKLLSQESKRFAVSDAASDRTKNIVRAVSNEAMQTSDEMWYQSESDEDIECPQEPEVRSNVNCITGGEIDVNPRDDGSESPQPTNTIVQFDTILNNTSVIALRDLLMKLRCPLMDMSYFDSESMFRMLPHDHLTLSRNVLVTLNHCLDYWTELETGEQRLCWSALSDSAFDEFLHLLVLNQGMRLSLMASDMSLLRNIPVFPSLNGDRISLKAGANYFVLEDSVNADSLAMYLPSRLRSQFLIEIPGLKDLLMDLGVQSLTEALVLQKYVLPNFSVLPNSQKSKVSVVILQRWESLKTTEFMEELKRCPFVKKAVHDQNNSEIMYVTPENLLDPCNELLAAIFDRSPSVFPAEEFATREWLHILSYLGMKNELDKDLFLKCAKRIQLECDVSKGMLLMQYFLNTFGQFSCTPEFCKQLSEIKCIPAELSSAPLALYCSKDVSIPLHRHLVYKVLPVIPEGIVPPQVVFSSLKIISPPPISVVLKQLKHLTIENQISLENWSYVHGSPEDVFRSIFSFLEDNYDKLSPRIQSGLKDCAMIPVGTTLVKPSRLFFRLAKDLTPFFFEVPRAFGAYEKLLRELGVRETPRSHDYAVSLKDLKREIGDHRLNANELKSVIDVIRLIADVEKSTDLMTIFLPDEKGTLRPMKSLLRNDAPWILHKINSCALHLVHPRVSEELCNHLKVPRISSSVTEDLEEAFEPRVMHQQIVGISHIERQMKSSTFKGALECMSSMKGSVRLQSLSQMTVLPVESLRTKFTLATADGDHVDITLDPTASVSFIDKVRVLLVVERLPDGVTPELAVASSLCDYFGILRQNVAVVAALLSSTTDCFSGISRTLGLLPHGDRESTRGDLGVPLSESDLSVIELRPLKTYNKGEIVAVKDEQDRLVYALMVEGGGGSYLSRFRVLTGEGEKNLISSEIYSFRSTSSLHQQSNTLHEQMNQTVVNGRVQVQALDSTVVEDAITALPPVDSKELLRAVQDILRSANMSLSDTVKDHLARTLKLQKELAKKTAENETLVNEGRELAKQLIVGSDAFACPITREIMDDPVICSDGHTYERVAIEHWLQSNSRSPKTNQQLSSRVLIPNYAMRQAIESISESLSSMKKFSEKFK